MPSPETPTKPHGFFCSLSSQAAGESLLGAAPQVSTWFLLEHNGKWGYKAFRESSIPEKVKSHFNQHLDDNHRSRLLLIKQSPSNQASGLSFYVALSSQPQPSLYKFQFDHYEDLLAFDLDSLAQGDAKYQSNISSESIFLICSNGLRDQCCAKYGLPIYNTLNPQLGASLWQSSHHGGHRFGPNLLCLPYGLSYGRVSPDNAPVITRKYLQGEIHLPNLRGRTAYPKPAQAAEALLRASLQDSALSNLTLASLEKQSDSEWMVTFSAKDNSTHLVHLSKESFETRLFASCIGDKQVVISEYRLLEHTVK